MHYNKLFYNYASSILQVVGEHNGTTLSNSTLSAVSAAKKIGGPVSSNM